MIATLEIGTTRIAYTDIPADRSLSRRERESRAVFTILSHLEVSPESLTHDADGAPLLPHSHISISHSAKLAVVAIDACRPIGIDAEEPRPQLERVKAKFLSPSELLVFNSLPQLLAAWTIKEAVYKIVGAAATDFKASIAVAPDLSQAHAQGRLFAIHAFDMSETHIALAVPV